MIFTKKNSLVLVAVAIVGLMVAGFTSDKKEKRKAIVGRWVVDSCQTKSNNPLVPIGKSNTEDFIGQANVFNADGSFFISEPNGNKLDTGFYSIKKIHRKTTLIFAIPGVKEKVYSEVISITQTKMILKSDYGIAYICFYYTRH